jgi:hypothetical protein
MFCNLEFLVCLFYFNLYYFMEVQIDSYNHLIIIKINKLFSSSYLHKFFAPIEQISLPIEALYMSLTKNPI